MMLFTAVEAGLPTIMKTTLLQTIEKHRLPEPEIAQSWNPCATAIGGGRLARQNPGPIAKIGCDSSRKYGCRIVHGVGEVPKRVSCRIGFNSSGTLGFWKTRQHRRKPERENRPVAVYA